jgi:hypothetical protein
VIYFLEQLGVLALLICGAWLGWRRWIMPHRQQLDAEGSSMLVLAALTVAGGLIGSPFWWMDIPGSFSWALPLLAARLLAAAGIAFAVTGCYAIEQKKESLVRSYIVMVAVYLAPLVAAILLFHLDRFDWRAPITYAFFAVAGGMTIAAVWHLVRGTRLDADFQGSTEQGAPVIGQLWLSLVTIVTGLWGFALFIYPSGPWPQIWIWPHDTLTSRLIAVMLLTLCTGAILGRQSAAQARMSLWMFVAYGAAASLACYANAVAGKPVPMAYAAVFSALLLISLSVLLFPLWKAPQVARRAHAGE